MKIAQNRIFLNSAKRRLVEIKFWKTHKVNTIENESV